MYKLFLDDERDANLVDDLEWRDLMNLGSRPQDHLALLASISGEWIVARSYGDAMEILKEHGFPTFVSFDNDLAEEKEGRDFAQALIDHDLDHGSMPENFAWEAHTANRVAREHINETLRGYLRFKKAQAPCPSASVKPGI